MPLQLPTDTQHMRLHTRQYELFNRSLGQGVDRRALWTAVAAGAVWFAVMALLEVNPISRFGPLAYLAPVAGFVIYGTRLDDTGRMALIGWYDALLARRPSRRSPITNPLLTTDSAAQQPLSLQVTTRVVPNGETATARTRTRRRAK